MRRGRRVGEDQSEARDGNERTFLACAAPAAQKSSLCASVSRGARASNSSATFYSPSSQRSQDIQAKEAIRAGNNKGVFPTPTHSYDAKGRKAESSDEAGTGCVPQQRSGRGTHRRDALSKDSPSRTNNSPTIQTTFCFKNVQALWSEALQALVPELWIGVLVRFPLPVSVVLECDCRSRKEGACHL